MSTSVELLLVLAELKIMLVITELVGVHDVPKTSPQSPVTNWICPPLVYIYAIDFFKVGENPTALSCCLFFFLSLLAC